MPTPTNPESDDDLVAYLDGELADADAHAVESKLATDAEVRRKAERLQKTFDLLAHLPKTEPSPNFATRTLTQIRPAVAEASASTLAPTAAPAPRVRPGKAVAWAAALVAIAAAGYVLHLLARPHLITPGAAGRASDHVRLLERLPLLLGADDLDFVRQLDHPDFFGEADHDHPAGRAGAETWSSAEIGHLENLFKEFPPARQEQLRKLDDDLARLPADQQAALLAVLERYAIWLDRLSDNYRREVLAAPAAVERLETIRVMKARLWREGLPVVVRQRILEADAPAREQLIVDRKSQDAERKHLWDQAKEHWASVRTGRRPYPFENEPLTRQVDEYVEKVLKPRLTGVERSDLELLRKDLPASTDWLRWYQYGSFVTRIVDLHPMYPEPANGKPVKSRDDLPKLFLQQLGKAAGAGRKQFNANHPTSGRWPDFALAVASEAAELKVPTTGVNLGPNKPADYGPAVREFLELALVKRLTKAEREELTKAEHGTWPDHSRKLLELAHKHDLSVPGVSLPGEPAMWDKQYRPRPARK